MPVDFEGRPPIDESIYFPIGQPTFGFDLPSAPSPGEVLFNCEEESDVIFMVTMDPAGVEDKWRFPAHSFILSESSPIFEAIIQEFNRQRNGDDENEKIMINIQCRPEIFHMLLSYIYKKEVNMNSIGNCLALLEVSARFALSQLSRLCLSYLYQEVGENNVLEILLQLRRLERPPQPSAPLEQFNWECESLLKKLLAKCYHTLDASAESILKSDSFTTLDESFLVQILERDTLNVSSELTVFDCVDRWTITQCLRQHRPLAAESRRQIAEPVLHTVRFQTMDVDTFMRGPFTSDLLDENEKKNYLIKLRQSTNHSSEQEKSARSRSFVPITFAVDDVELACYADLRRTGCGVNGGVIDFNHLINGGFGKNIDLTGGGGGANENGNNGNVRLLVTKRKNSPFKKFLSGLGGVMVCVIQLLD